MHLVIGEAALHQQVGGPEVMEGQLGLLAGIAGDSGTVTVQILPFAAGAHAAAGDGSLALLQFAEAPGLGLVHLGGITGGSVPGKPGRPRRLRPRLRAAAGVRAQPRAVRRCTSAAWQAPDTHNGLCRRANPARRQHGQRPTGGENPPPASRPENRRPRPGSRTHHHSKG